MRTVDRESYAEVMGLKEANTHRKTMLDVLDEGSSAGGTRE
jgi:hypothetical protein